MLSEKGPPGLPAMVAHLIPLVTPVLHAGLVPEEIEQRSPGFLRVQSSHGLAASLVLALGWRMLVMWAVARGHQVAENAKRRKVKSELLPVSTDTCAPSSSTVGTTRRGQNPVLASSDISLIVHSAQLSHELVDEWVVRLGFALAHLQMP